MRRLVIMSALIFAFLAEVDAQSEVVVNEVVEYMSQGEKVGLEVALVDVEPKDAEKYWKKYLKKFKSRTKSSRKSPELFSDDAKIEKISDNTVDVYAKASQAAYGTRMVVFFDLGGSYVSSQEHEIAFGAAVNFLKEFALNQATRVVKNELKLQEKNLKELNKELENFIEDKASYIKDIEEAKALIAQREQDIINNEAAQETKRAQIAIQEEILKTIKEKRAQLNY